MEEKNTHGGARPGSGRKPLEPGLHRVKLWISCTAQQQQQIKDKAKKQGVTVSQYVLNACSVD